MRTRIFIPPLQKATGGTNVLHQVGEQLLALGHDVALVPYGEGVPNLPETAVPCIAWESLELCADDIWLVPEGWVNGLMPGLQAGARNVVYVQNWAYLHAALPEGVRWNQLDVHFLSVSEPVAWYTKQTTGRKSPVLRPGIDRTLFYPPKHKPAYSLPLKNGGTAADTAPLRIAWMPRKNSALAKQIRQTFEARLSVSGLGEALAVEWVEIHGLSREEVAEHLRSAHIFLATGFPEGFALPPLEAIASGCLTVGFAGIGGWEYMRQAMPHGHKPWWKLPEADWGGNAFVVGDADVPAAAFALEYVCALLASEAGLPVPEAALRNPYSLSGAVLFCGKDVHDPEQPGPVQEGVDASLADVRKQMQLTADAYTYAQQRENIRLLWEQARLGNVFR